MTDEPDNEAVEARLERMLADAQNTVTRLRDELEAVRATRLRDAKEAAQHAEVERLEEHLSRAQVHWGAVQAFFEAAMRELRERQTADDGSDPALQQGE